MISSSMGRAGVVHQKTSPNAKAVAQIQIGGAGTPQGARKIPRPVATRLKKSPPQTTQSPFGIRIFFTALTPRPEDLLVPRTASWAGSPKETR